MLIVFIRVGQYSNITVKPYYHMVDFFIVPKCHKYLILVFIITNDLLWDSCELKLNANDYYWHDLYS